MPLEMRHRREVEFPTPTILNACNAIWRRAKDEGVNEEERFQRVLLFLVHISLADDGGNFKMKKGRKPRREMEEYIRVNLDFFIQSTKNAIAVALLTN